MDNLRIVNTVKMSLAYLTANMNIMFDLYNGGFA